MSPDLAAALPEPPADPLHILPPASLPVLLAALAVLLLVLAWMMLRRFSRRKPAAATTPPPVPEPAATGTPETGFTARIEAIERKYLKTKEFRDGCHALATAVKTHVGRSTGLDAERLTSPEIARAVEDQRVGRFMIDLSWRRYGRNEPRRKHFVEACARAREVLA